jgi:hypothetical protein
MLEKQRQKGTSTFFFKIFYGARIARSSGVHGNIIHVVLASQNITVRLEMFTHSEIPFHLFNGQNGHMNRGSNVTQNVLKC